MDIKFIETEKRCKKLNINSYSFNNNNTIGNRTYWKCEMYCKSSCRARVITESDKVVKSTLDHNHVADAAKMQAEETVIKIRQLAESTQAQPHTLISTALEETNAHLFATKLPPMRNLKRTVRNIRQKKLAAPSLPSSCTELCLPTQYTETVRGEPFLLYDSGPAENRILIFSTKANLQCLSQSKHWYADGTFKTVPLIFKQLYTIHGFQRRTSIPLLFALLSNKREETYQNLLRQIKILEQSCAPQSITLDFEKAMTAACSKEFPAASQSGCFFHFSQCIFRAIQHHGLKRRYEVEIEFALKMRMLPALAFVPVADVPLAFDALCHNEIFPEEAEDVINYFEDTWIGRPNRRAGRNSPKFPYTMWNVFLRVLNDQPKTNNSVEGWHRAFETQVGCHHANIWKFIAALQAEQNVNEWQIEQANSGDEGQPPRKKYQDVGKRLKNVVGQYNRDTDVITYLRSIAHNLSF